MPTQPQTDQTANTAAHLETRMKIEIREIGIPPRPTILAQIEAEAAKDDPDFISLAKLLGKDVGLAAGMIKIANSPYFAFGRKVPTIQEALLVLGLKLVMKTISGLALQQVFKHAPNMEWFWDASAMTAEVSACLAKQLGRNIGIRPEDAHTFALFRDCGLPMLMIPFPEYRDVLTRAGSETTLSFTDIEDQALGLNHAAIGAQLAEDWLLPGETCLAIQHHHDVAALNGSLGIAPRARQLIAIAMVADYLIQEKSSQPPASEWNKLGPDCLATLNLTPEALPELGALCTAELGC